DPQTTCYRLIPGEGDSLPGLVVDIYGSTAVVQCHSVGMYRARQEISDAIRQVYGERITAIYDKSSQTLPYKAELGAVDGYLWGTTDHASQVVSEHGEKFVVNWEKGQKTGFFLDQRENRELVKRYAKGRTVLNTFCYTGGFSVYALSGGAKEVCSVDSSERAVALATENMRLNFGEGAPHTEVAANAVEYLRDIGDKYDLIILDPPAFAKHHKVLGNAMQGYKRLNARALSQIKPGGILFTFSCSQAVSKELFRTTVFSAAAIAGRKVRILHQLTQPADHPINIYHPEGEYLKGLVLYVE
ncbi:MAG: class I SAM-dependent rRNA methyltransferase, partial [Alistipes sp.]|nr:class I SAM-dependent rRNA methyltransferase [Alistipes sp.]